MTKHTKFSHYYLCLAALSAPVGGHAAVTNLAVVADTFINAGALSTDNNAGAQPWFDAGTDGNGGVRRGLFRFDLRVIPPGSTITSAAVQLTVTKVPLFGAVNSTFDLFRLTTGWNEGAQVGNAGALAATGEATWNARMNNLARWTLPGAASDVPGTASASTAIAGFGTYSWSSASLLNDVQFWVNSPPLNSGWLLVSQAEGSLRTVRGFAARENGLSVGTLQVGYIPPPAPTPAAFNSIRLTNTAAVAPAVSLTNGSIAFTWQGSTNGAFDLLYSSTVGSTAIWNLAQPNILGAASGSNSLSDPPYLVSPGYAPNAKLFYRLNSLPPPAPPLAVRLQVVVSNLVAPTVLTHAHDGSGRLFIADQTGPIWIADSNRNLLATPFLDLTSRMTNLAPIGIGGITNPGINPLYDERGLLGLAFHPGYATNGRFFVYYAAPSPSTNFDNMTVLSEFRVSATDTNLADSTSERVLLTINEPEFNHEGADIVFGPDGYLYLGTGDGGGGGDQHGTTGNGQLLNTLLGKMLRIDVDGTNAANGHYGIPLDNPFVSTPGALPEIYAYGLRNPCRFSFDRGGTREGFVADVGQNFYEELNILRKGANYGWRILEGNHAYDPALATTLGVNIPSLDFPIFEYVHGPIGIAMIGGFVYRGAAHPDLVGKYVFGDFSTSFGLPDGQLYYLAQTRPGIWERFSFQLYPSGGRLARYIKGFGEDEAGEIYLLSTTRLGPAGNTGDVRRLVRP